MSSLRARKEWKFFAVLPKAAPALAAAWWVALIMRGVLPVVFGVAMGLLVGAVQSGADLSTPSSMAASSSSARTTS